MLLITLPAEHANGQRCIARLDDVRVGFSPLASPNIRKLKVKIIIPNFHGSYWGRCPKDSGDGY